MIARGLLQIVLGWTYHTIYRAQCHWTLKREGALIAAAVVLSIGAVDTLRSGTHERPISASPAVMADATPPVSEQKPVEVSATPVAILPPVSEVDGIAVGALTSAAMPAPSELVRSNEPIVAFGDDIGAKIVSEKLYLDPIATGSINDKPKKPQAPAVVKPTPAKPDTTTQARPSAPLPRAKPAQAPARRKPVAKPDLIQRSDNK